MRGKVFLVLMALFATATINAQTNNFAVSDDGKLIWQRVFDSQASYQDIYNLVLNSGSFTDIVDNDGVITCRIPQTMVDFKSMGFSRGNIPIYVATNDFTGFATIQVKEGRYRVTVEKIVMICNENGLSKVGDETPLDTWGVRRGNLTNGFLGNPSDIYNQFLTNLFTMKQKSFLENDEW